MKKFFLFFIAFLAFVLFISMAFYEDTAKKNQVVVNPVKIISIDDHADQGEVSQNEISKSEPEIRSSQPMAPLKTYKRHLDKSLSRSNGIVTNIWIEGEDRLDKLRNNNIKYLFVDVGGTSKDGSITTPKEEILSFLQVIDDYQSKHNYNFTLLAYSEVMATEYSLDAAFKKNFVQTYSDLVELGFHGLLVDIEAIQNSKKISYLEILKGLRTNLPENSIISVYAGPIGSNIDNYWEWDYDFYKSVAQFVDIIVLQGYDLSYDSGDDYQNFLREEIAKISEDNFPCYFMLGVPTHKSYPETMRNALSAYKNELILHDGNQFLGVSIFAEWTITENDWSVYKVYFQRGSI